MQMVTGDDSHVALAESYVRSIAAFGATEHESALKMALRMGPDVIFFLTDARIPRLSAVELRQIKDRADAVARRFTALSLVQNPSHRGTVSCANWPRSHAEYRYVDVRASATGGRRPTIRAIGLGRSNRAVNG